MQEKELFSSLIRELPEKTYGRLENSVLPNKLISDKYRAYYNDPYSLWFIRVPVSENEVYYYFGFDVYRDPLSPGLIFRFNTDGEESDIKFLDDALTLHVAVEGNDPEIKSHLS